MEEASDTLMVHSTLTLLIAAECLIECYYISVIECNGVKA
jgi:hypothetical protein